MFKFSIFLSKTLKSLFQLCPPNNQLTLNSYFETALRWHPLKCRCHINNWMNSNAKLTANCVWFENVFQRLFALECCLLPKQWTRCFEVIQVNRKWIWAKSDYGRRWFHNIDYYTTNVELIVVRTSRPESDFGGSGWSKNFQSFCRFRNTIDVFVPLDIRFGLGNFDWNSILIMWLYYMHVWRAFNGSFVMVFSQVTIVSPEWRWRVFCRLYSGRHALQFSFWMPF